MVSYTRARAESLGIDCRLGIMQRAERMVLLMFGTLVAIISGYFDAVMIGIIIFLALASNFTAWQRIAYVYKIEKGKEAF
jgi:CDP-diacylglycerol--glycerol-3-phosphate 3-phosphatidyltransferase